MRTTSLLLILAAAAIGCAGDASTDYDNDGVTADIDCDDLDESQGEARIWYADADGDGWGGEGEGAATQESCDRPTDGLWALRTGDCDDSDAGISPSADEACNGVDDDCDTFTDENTDKGLWYADADGDGFGDPATSTERCDGTGGYVGNGRDCDDTNADSKPGADEICDGLDNDCDARIDESDAIDATGWYLDADADGYGQTTTEVIACEAPSPNWSDAGDDCNDNSVSINPGVPERCDGFDNNCDGRIDGEDAEDALDWYADDDGDGFGDDDASVKACLPPEGFIAEGGDCDDRNRFLNPATLWFLDADGDNYGDPGMSTVSCTDPSATGSVYVSNSQDCDDGDGDVSPLGTEECDGIDNDCDGTADGGDAVDAETYFMDFDGDGFGDSVRTGRACSRPDGFTTDDTDCNDDNAQVYPGAVEFCDELDNDCDSLIDYADPDVQVLTWYQDSDGDDYGKTSVTQESCEQPLGYVMDDGDCADDDPAVNPSALEVCDAGLDNDCNGLADKADPNWTGEDGTWYRDVDGDGYGDDSLSVITCSAPTGYVRNDYDCNDSDSTKWNTCWSGPRNFTTCSAKGRLGPTSCSYSGTTLEGEVTVTSGKQKWTVPQDGTYRIEAWGAEGAATTNTSYSTKPSKGARMRGDFELEEGDVLWIAVGQAGTPAIYGGGGGGGSFVVDDNDDPLIIAGGGGGIYYFVGYYVSGASGCSGQSGIYGGNGTTSSSSASCSTKSSGQGVGGTAYSSVGAGGGGLKSSGATNTRGTTGGAGWLQGLAGGQNSSAGTGNALGGFGGGGGAYFAGGGGGGYSGGNSGYTAGGGGSYNDGTDVSNASGAHSGAGKVVIDWLGR